MSIRVRFDGRVLIPVEPVDLPTDRLLEVDVRAVEGEPPPGSPQLLLQLMRQPPHIDPEIVDEFERGIAAGKLPVKYDAVFDGDDGAIPT
jgi:hypothetical protein